MRGPGADNFSWRREGRNESIQEAVILNVGNILRGYPKSRKVGKQRGDELLQLGSRVVVGPVWCHAEAAAGL
jgi:hypothetical protein